MINRAILTQQVSVGAQTATLAHDAEHKPLQACHRPPSCTGMTTEKQPARECPVLHASARTPPRAARERPVSYIRCSGPGARTSCECDACKRNRREACSAKRPWRMMQNTSRCRRVIGRRHHLRSTPAPLRPLAAAPPCPKSPRAREVCGGSKLEATLKLLNGKSSGPRPQFVPVPFGLNLPLDFVP